MINEDGFQEYINNNFKCGDIVIIPVYRSLFGIRQVFYDYHDVILKSKTPNLVLEEIPPFYNEKFDSVEQAENAYKSWKIFVKKNLPQKIKSIEL